MSDNPEALRQECADFATSLRSAYNVAGLKGKAPPSFLRAADLFERAAAALAQQAATPAPAEQTERDAARYRWLRDASEWEPFTSAWLNEWDIYGGEGPDLDAAIDAEMSAAPPATPAAQPLTTCNCRWNGDKLVQQCTLHEAWRDAIHDWARRAKEAEAKLAAPAAQPADEREAFEAWLSRDAFTERSDTGKYVSAHVDAMWSAWQARAALEGAAPSAEPSDT